MERHYLDDEERDLMESVERGEWISVKNLDQEIENHRQYAHNTLRKDKRVNIRISSRDLEALQTKAVEDGIPYQTLMTSVLHRFVAGRLKEA
uniref:Predicted DNA binding protein, CopG/RHH family n=1 Tax=Candidatus Kentrum sp. FW TaxID=2126338 RepID=A0A450TEA2_9GAMM|nr:MAG: Predicted DNA binding protein, CopG/RHH family [Candidatus Kentron sp. FW]